MTRVQILNDLKAILGPGVGATDSELNTWINDSYFQMVDSIQKERWDYFIKSCLASTVANQQEYTLPTDFIKMTKVNMKIDGTWRPVSPLGDADLRYVDTPADTTDQGFSAASPRYYIYKNTMGLLPVPTATGSQDIKIWYVYSPSELSTDSSTPDFPTIYHTNLKYGAFANYLDRKGEHVAAERMRQRFDEMNQKMVENLSLHQTGETKSVMVTDYEYYQDPTWQ
jgi:hypothetical protein